MLLTVETLTKKIQGKTIVDTLSLSIERGQFIAILGPNGAGKSTTIKMLTGSLPPTSGKIIYQSSTKIGVVFQASVLDDELTVEENLRIRARQYRQVSTNRIPQLIEQLGLSSFKKQSYRSLSGGQKRRVDIARALINQPDILFLDEPTTGLDIQTRTAIWQLLTDLQQNQNLAIVLTTHYLEETEQADYLYIIDQGKVKTQGTVTQIKSIYAKPQLQIEVENAQNFYHALPTEEVSEILTNHSILLTPSNWQMALDFLTTYRTQIQDFTYRNGTMNDAFLKLTGKEMK